MQKERRHRSLGKWVGDRHQIDSPIHLHVSVARRKKHIAEFIPKEFDE